MQALAVHECVHVRACVIVFGLAWCRSQGFNNTLFAYGQTGAGKSYSMIGTMPTRSKDGIQAWTTPWHVAHSAPCVTPHTVAPVIPSGRTVQRALAVVCGGRSRYCRHAHGYNTTAAMRRAAQPPWHHPSYACHSAYSMLGLHSLAPGRAAGVRHATLVELQQTTVRHASDNVRLVTYN
jgi:hypothetical protein